MYVWCSIYMMFNHCREQGLIGTNSLVTSENSADLEKTLLKCNTHFPNIDTNLRQEFLYIISSTYTKYLKVFTDDGTKNKDGTGSAINTNLE